MYKIYKFTLPNGKVYIGQTKDKHLYRRHQYGNGYIKNTEFYNDILAFGWENIKEEILEEVETKEKAIQRERFHILAHRSHLPEHGYNKHTNLDCEPKLRKYYRCVETGKVYETMVMIAEEIGVTKAAVSLAMKQERACQGRTYEKVYMTREEYQTLRSV